VILSNGSLGMDGSRQSPPPPNALKGKRVEKEEEIYESSWTFGRTPWTGDQPDTRPLPTQDNTTQKNEDKHIHLSSGIRTKDPKSSSGLRLRGQWDRQI
jgi:hypothetical protein